MIHPQAEKSVFPTLLSEGGPVMPLIVLAALAGYVLACERLLVWAAWHWRDRPLLKAQNGADLVRRLKELAARADLTPYRRVLTQALYVTRYPLEKREAAVQAAVMGQMSKVEARISTIGWLGTILPLLGLLGTVSGMIATFQDLSVTSSRQVLSQGLSEALWTTEVGLIGALPLMAAHHLLSRLKSRWVNHLERALALITITARAKTASATTITTEPSTGKRGKSVQKAGTGTRHEP